MLLKAETKIIYPKSDHIQLNGAGVEFYSKDFEEETIEEELWIECNSLCLGSIETCSINSSKFLKKHNFCFSQ